MSPEERQLLAGLFDRVRGQSTVPRDAEAEAFISDAVRAQPYAPYLLAQSVIVQEAALRAANDKLQQLEAQVQQLQQAPPQPAAAGGSFLGSLFGGGSSPAPQPAPSAVPPSGPWQQPQQGYAPSDPPQAPQGPWGGAMAAPAGGGGGFLKGALGAAAGVAGGVLLADSIRGLFGAHNNPFGMGTGLTDFGGLGGGLGAGGLGNGLGAGGLGGGGETVINNYYNNDGDPGAAVQDADYGTDDGTDLSSSDDGGGGSFDV
jgi:hypothetical protein